MVFKMRILGSKRSEKFYCYFALIILFLTTFPLAQGWLPLGDFRPRVLLMGVTLILYAQRFFSKDLIYLYVFFLYSAVSHYFCGADFSIVNLFTQLMEFLVPILLVPTALLGNKTNTYLVARFSIILTLLTVFLTLRYVAIDSEIIRNMVTISAWEGIEGVRKYWRIGVCSYSFALIMMCVPPIMIQCSMASKKKFLKVVYLLIAVLLLYFVYASQVTTTFFLCLLMIMLVMTTRKMSMRGAFLWVVAVTFVLIISLSFILQVLMGFFSAETVIGAHISGLYQFLFEGSVSSDVYAVDGRAELYNSSIDVFLRNPLFGNTLEKIGGHNYILDNLARYGIVGTLPLFMFFFYRFKMTLESLPIADKKAYAICLMGFVAMASIKNIAGIDHWTYLFLYIPCFLRMANNRADENRISDIISR